MSKVFRGLSPRYNTFVDQFHLLDDDGVITNVREITIKLLTYESKPSEREAEEAHSRNLFRKQRSERRRYINKQEMRLETL